MATEVEICNMAFFELGESQITALSDMTGLEAMLDNTRDELLGLYPWPFAMKRTRLTAAGLLDCSAKTITFVVNSGADTVTDGGSGFVTGGFVAKEILTVVGSGSNEYDYKINTVAAGTLTLEAFEVVKAETLTNDADLKLYARPSSKWSYKYSKPSDSLAIWEVNEHKVSGMRDNVFDIENDYIVTDEIDEEDQIDIAYTQQITDPTKFSLLFQQVLVLKLAAKLSIPKTNNVAIRDALEARAKAKMLDNMAASEGSRNEDREDFGWQVR